MDPKAILAAIVLLVIVLFVFMRGEWKSAVAALAIVLAIMEVLQAFGLW